MPEGTLSVSSGRQQSTEEDYKWRLEFGSEQYLSGNLQDISCSAVIVGKVSDFNVLFNLRT